MQHVVGFAVFAHTHNEHRHTDQGVLGVPPGVRVPSEKRRQQHATDTHEHNALVGG